MFETHVLYYVLFLNKCWKCLKQRLRLAPSKIIKFHCKITILYFHIYLFIESKFINNLYIYIYIYIYILYYILCLIFIETRGDTFGCLGRRRKDVGGPIDKGGKASGGCNRRRRRRRWRQGKRRRRQKEEASLRKN